MKIEIKNIESRDIWENFVNSAKPHTFLHSWNWGELNEKLGYKTFKLGIYEDGKLKGLALTIKIKARRGSFLFVPHGPILEVESEKLKFKS